MRVAMMVGFLMFQVVTGIYDSGWLDEAAPLDQEGAVQACEDGVPPPPSFP